MWLEEVMKHGVQVETRFGEEGVSYYLVDPRYIYPKTYKGWPRGFNKALVFNFCYETSSTTFHSLVNDFRLREDKRNYYLDTGRLNWVLLENIEYKGPGFSTSNSGRPPSRTRRGKRHKFTLEGLHVPEEDA